MNTTPPEDVDITLKEKVLLWKTLHRQGYDQIAFWADGSWESVGSGYGGEQDGRNPEFLLSRTTFFNVTARNCRRMVKAIELELNGGLSCEEEYRLLGGTY